MPIFEFRCADCGHIFEKLFFNSEEEGVMACPKCQCESIERVVSRASYTIGAGPEGNQPRITTKSCGEENKCITMDLPGPAK